MAVSGEVRVGRWRFHARDAVLLAGIGSGIWRPTVNATFPGILASRFTWAELDFPLV